MNGYNIRVYDKLNQTKSDVSEIDFSRKKVIALYKGFLPNIFDFDDVEFLRSSGLFDQNNREVYEKDILFNGENYSEVVYDNQQACFVGMLDSTIHRLVDLVVLGYYVVDGS